MNKKFLSYGIIAFVSLISCNTGNKNDSKDVAKDSNNKKFENKGRDMDASFAVVAADGGLMEVELGKLALVNASAAQVRDFGRMMIDDHSKANAELKALTVSENISVPDSLSEKNRSKYDELAKKHGNSFDKSYTSFMVDDHKEDIDEFKKEADKGNNVALKQWAAGTIAVLQHHLQMAQAADSLVKNNH